MSIWLIILPFGVATYAMRGAFLFRVHASTRSPRWQRWLRFVPSAVLAALVLPALVDSGNPFAPDALHHLLAAGLAAVVAWRFQNVLATVASGMMAYWGLRWLPNLTISLLIPLGLLLLASGGLLLLLLGSALAWFRLTRRAAGPGLGTVAPTTAVTVTPVEDRLLPAEAVSLRVQKPAGAHLHCPWCWCPLPVWALYCGHCGLPQPFPALAVTQPLAAVTVRPEGSEQVSLPNGARAERTRSLPRMAEERGRSAPTLTRPARQTARAFWVFWTGETISNLGSAFTTFALPLLVFKLTGSALNLGLTTAATFLPYLLFGLVIGAWVDRLDRKRLMLLVDLGQALVIGSIPVMYLLGALSLWWVYGVAFVSGTLKIAFECGQFAAIPRLVRQAELMTANGRMQASFSGAQVLGPVLAGLLLFALPLPTLLFIDAGSFLASACALALIATRFNGAARHEQASIRHEVAEGLRYVWGHPVLRVLSLFLPLVNVLSIISLSQLVVLATVHFHAATWQVSVLYSAAGTGVVLCSFLAGPLRRRLPFSRLVLGTVAAAGVLTVTLAVVPWYWLAVGVWAVKAGMEVLFNLSYLSLRQTLVPNHLLGRVISSSRVLAYSTGPLGALLGGLLLSWVGLAHIGQVYLGIGLVIALLPLAFAGTALAQAERFLPGQSEAPGFPLAARSAGEARDATGED